MNFVQVAISSPLRQTFTYINNSKQDLLGKRVLVEFGRRKMVGIVLEEIDEFKSEYKLKEVIEVLDDTPLFSKKRITEILAISEHYMHPVGSVIESFIPTYLRKAKHQSTLVKYDSELPKPNILDNFHKLNTEQSDCLKLISKKPKGEILFSGITSSGKTEVYKHYVRKLIEEGKSALVMVPEIFLTPQIYEDFKKSFGDIVFLHHSGLTDIQRIKIWLAAKKSGPKIILGTRSAIFLPIKNLGGIIFDEEHDQSYKQQESFRYDARNLARLLHVENVRIVYASATPSLSNLNKANLQLIEKCSLTKRISNSTMPKITIHAANKKDTHGGISKSLIDQIVANFDKGFQTLILLNRRGYAPVFMCNSCGWIAKSNCCETSLVYHQDVRRLKCHRCESVWGIPSECPNCEDGDFSFKGTGTQQIEETIKEVMPYSEVVRIDKDSVAGKNRREESSKYLHDEKPRVFIGTQLLAKGHDFKKVSLVVVLNLDFGLFGADIHMQEQTAQLIIQVAGRAGRTGINNDVFLQTRVADHPLFQLIKSGDYNKIANELLKERKKLDLSPFINLSYLKAEDANQARVRKFLVNAKKSLSQEGLEIYGPFEGPIAKSGYKHRMFCIIQSADYEVMTKRLKDFVSKTNFEKKDVSNWVIDIDPINAA